MATRLTYEEVQAILDKGTFPDLVGAVEGDALECKSAPYQLEDEAKKYELAKDVSGIARTRWSAWCRAVGKCPVSVPSPAVAP